MERLIRNGERNTKVREPPVWGCESFQAWRRRILIWDEETSIPEKKATMLIESLKKNVEQKGLKEMTEQDIIEDPNFDYKDGDVIKTIMDKIEEFIDESKWSKMIKLNKEFTNFKQGEDEKADEYVVRFGTLENKLKHEKVTMNEMFLATHLLNQSKFRQEEKENIMASIDMDDEKTVLKNIKTKIRRLKAMN